MTAYKEPWISFSNERAKGKHIEPPTQKRIKKAYCQTCKAIYSIRNQWIHDLCRDCKGWVNTPTRYIIVSLMTDMMDLKEKYLQLHRELMDCHRKLHRDP